MSWPPQTRDPLATYTRGQGGLRGAVSVVLAAVGTLSTTTAAWATMNGRIAALSAGLGGDLLGLLPAADGAFSWPEILIGSGADKT